MQVRILFLIQMIPNKDVNAIFMMQMSRVGIKMQSFFHDDASAHIYTMMQMSPCRDGDAKNLGVQMLSNGYVLM